MNQGQGDYSNPAGAIWKGVKDQFKKQEKVGFLKDTERLDGKRMLITGANSGLGFATAIQLAERGAEVIMAGRSGIPEKGVEVKHKSGSDKVSMQRVELSDLDSMVALVQRLKAEQKSLDMVIFNAAVVPRQSRRTAQGLEEMFTVNYLAKYLLARLLLQEGLINLEGVDRSRIIFVSSESHRNPKAFEWEKFGKYQDYGMEKTVALYGYYKLLLTTFATELSRRLQQKEGRQPGVYALCPGPVNSSIAKEAPKAFKPLIKIIFSLFFRAPEKAAEPVLYLACAKEMESINLDYFFLMSRKPMDAKSQEKENGEKLWRLSEQLLEEKGIFLSPF